MLSADVYGQVWGGDRGLGAGAKQSATWSPVQITHEKADGVHEESLSNVHTLTIRRCGPLYQSHLWHVVTRRGGGGGAPWWAGTHREQRDAVGGCHPPR